MADEILLEWTYTPADLFEDRIELLVDACAFVIDAGTVVGHAPVEGELPADLGSFFNTMHQRLDAAFLGAQILAHKAYKLSGPNNIVRLSSDGRRHAYVLAEVGTLNLSLGVVDVLIADGAGNVTVDTRAARIARRRDIALKASAHIADPAANSILRSYSAAVNDPRNELIHLYEIRDAMQKHFRSKGKAMKALNVSSAEWGAIGRLACYEPLLQGRHRGEHPGALRPATVEELSEARAIGRKMIERYLAQLETTGRP